jgi:hypothetical protein
MNPGDTWEGRGQLLIHGRFVAEVDYHLTLPAETHFYLNPTGKLRFAYEDYLAGFILLAPTDEANISLGDYTLELANKSKKAIRIERRYKQIEHRGRPRVSYWIKVISDRK